MLESFLMQHLWPHCLFNFAEKELDHCGKSNGSRYFYWNLCSTRVRREKYFKRECFS